jgi:branched-chain amino acid transport system ATP-binding protein
MSTPLLEAHAVSAGYGGLAAVRDVTLEVRPGEVVCLLGSNGAGKTTTLLTLAGALAPIAGEVRWKGAATTAPLKRRARQGMALVTEERSVFMGLTVAQNLRLGRGPATRALELFPELRDHLPRRAGLLSGGQQQLLTLARTLAGAPEAILADELSLGLAPLVTRRLLEAVRAAADQGAAALIVEQRARVALDVADRAYVLQRGRIVLEGAAADLRGDVAAIEHAYLSGR